MGGMMGTVLGVLLLVPALFAASNPERFAIAESIAAHETAEDRIIAVPQGQYVAWHDRKNLFAASGPRYAARQLTHHADGIAITGVSAAPDGYSLFYVRQAYESAFGPYPDKLVRELWRLDVRSGQSVLLAQGKGAPSGRLSIAPDGKAFAFAEGAMLWEMRESGAQWARRPLLKNDPKHHQAARISGIAYSPDGERLAFTSERKAGQSYIGVVDLQTLAWRYLAPGIFQDRAASWAPDGQSLVFVRIADNWPMKYRFSPAAERVPWSLQLARADGSEVRQLWQADRGKGSAAGEDESPPLWTADRRILFLWEKTGWQQLYALPAQGGAPELLTPGEGEVGNVVLNADRTQVAYESNIGDVARQHLWTLRLDEGVPRRVDSGEGREAQGVLLSDGSLGYVTNDRGRMPTRRVVATKHGLVRLTPDRPAEAAYGKLWDRFVDEEVVAVTAEDGVVTYHLVMVPRDGKPKNGHPVIVTAKGGPTGRVLPGDGYADYTALGQYAASRGYIFVQMNYRGSSGFGLDYRYPEGRGAQGGSEVKDIAALVRYLKSRGDVDAQRMGIAGHSYGGHIVGLALSGLPAAFAAGIHMSGVADWVIEMKKDGGGSAPSPYVRLSEQIKIEDLAHASSSTAMVDQWRAPVLFIMGEADRKGHMESVMDLGYRLMERGVQTEYLILPDVGHGRPGAFPLDKMFEFFERTLGSKRVLPD